MLVKWAVEGRRKTAKAISPVNDNDRQKGAPTSLTGSPSVKNRSQMKRSADEPETTAKALTAQLDRLHYKNDAALARSAESDGDTAMRRIQAMERDTMLRNDKLLSLTGLERLPHHSHQGSSSQPSMPLTEENIEKLVQEQDGGSKGAVRTSDCESNEVNEPHSTVDSSMGKIRPSLIEARHRESEQTITKGAPS
jgi:hypothetical protein